MADRVGGDAEIALSLTVSTALMLLYVIIAVEAIWFSG